MSYPSSRARSNDFSISAFRILFVGDAGVSRSVEGEDVFTFPEPSVSVAFVYMMTSNDHATFLGDEVELGKEVLVERMSRTR
ncbi:MAG: hypothetical protein ACLTQI_00820 [Slackia sp.]